MNAHSPSPWHTGAIDEDADIVYDVDDNPIAYADQTGSKPTDGALKIDAANARLIAAAPDLAEAAALFTKATHDARDALNSAGLACPSSIAFVAEKARAALAKAGL
jgi:hypothetical protein